MTAGIGGTMVRVAIVLLLAPFIAPAWLLLACVMSALVRKQTLAEDGPTGDLM
jgi:hypothetical protein